LRIGHIRFVCPHEIIELDIRSHAILTPSLGSNLIQKCLWILRKKFKFQTTKKINYKHFQCLKQSLKALLEIKFPMLISVESKFATYHHVVVAWRQMVIDYESMYMYPLTENTLRQICGAITTFQQISCGYGILLSTITKHLRQINVFKTGAQKNISNMGALLGNISIGGDKVR
jgi:hypothetical protein